MSRWIGGDGDLRRSVALVDTGPEIDWVSGQSTYTSTGRTFGAENPRRIIVAAIAMQSLNNTTELLSGSIGGVTATVATQDAFHYTALMYASVPTGTSGNIIMTIGHDSDFICFPIIYVYRIVAKGPAPVFAGSANGTSSPIFCPQTFDFFTLQKNAVAISIGQNNRNSPTTWGSFIVDHIDNTVMIEDRDDTGLANSGAASCMHRGPDATPTSIWNVAYQTPGGSGSGNRRGMSTAVWY